MFYVSEIQTEAPCRFQTQLQEKVYEALEKLQISSVSIPMKRLLWRIALPLMKNWI